MFRLSLTRSSLCGVAIMIGVALARPAIAEGPAAASPEERTEAAAKSDYSNKRICKRQRQTGSHIPRTVCRTQAQIDADREAATEFVREENRQQGVRHPMIEQLPPVFN